MKAKDYRLKTVLRIRENAKDEAGRVVAQRLDDLDKANIELSSRQHDLLACYEKQDQKQSAMSEMLEAGMLARDVIRHRTFLDDLRGSEHELKDAADKQKKAVVRAENDLNSARDAFIDSTREFKAIETHREKWAANVRSSAARREQKLSDEIGGILYNRREA